MQLPPTKPHTPAGKCYVTIKYFYLPISNLLCVLV